MHLVTLIREMTENRVVLAVLMHPTTAAQWAGLAGCDRHGDGGRFQS